MFLSFSKLHSKHDPFWIIYMNQKNNKMKNLKKLVLEFMSNNPNQNEIELFYINKILPKTNDSIEEILQS